MGKAARAGGAAKAKAKVKADSQPKPVEDSWDDSATGSPATTAVESPFFKVDEEPVPEIVPDDQLILITPADAIAKSAQEEAERRQRKVMGKKSGAVKKKGSGSLNPWIVGSL